MCFGNKFRVNGAQTSKGAKSGFIKVKIRLLETETPMMRDYATLDSFVVYICMVGSVELRDDNDNELTVSQGQTVLFPATTQSVTLKPAPQTKLLETYIA